MTERLPESPSQTAGPYVHIGLVPNLLGISGLYPHDFGASPIKNGAMGEKIRIVGNVLDGDGTLIRDALLETWQADAGGRYPGTEGADPNVTGWARRITDLKTGAWQLDTIKPGAVPGPDGASMAPHVSVFLVARGINTGLQTRIYFADEARANAACPILSKADRPDTLIARQTAPGAYRFDIRLQGPDETTFFDI